jgi:hypothetical protein
MAKLWLDWSDGHYSTRPLSDEEAADHETRGLAVAHVEDRVYDAWLRHCAEDGVWQALWRAISNEQYLRRREAELMPLEDAEREIARLRDELSRAKRMEKFYEERYCAQIARKLRDEHVTCVHPQPGCQVEALPLKWRERAQEILEQYDSTRAAEGMTHQGCCCGHEHEKIDDATADQLRRAGFLVEHAAEDLNKDQS